jgi:outer membrane protein assembly factor BamB
VIVNGSVFAGSQDGNMYALNESTGATVWKDQSDGPIVAGAAFTGTLNTGTPNIAWGTQKGTLYLAATTTGALLYTQSGAYKNSPIVGVGANGGYLFAETASGFIGGTRRTGGLPTLGWGTQTGSTLSTAPAIIDGTLYVSANDGGVYAFSPHGSNPVPASRHSPIITITNQPWTCTTR